MKSSQSIQEIIAEELSSLYEAFYVAQEGIEESGFLNKTLLANQPLGENAESVVVGYEPR
jgi:hypothetical protein